MAVSLVEAKCSHQRGTERRRHKLRQFAEMLARSLAGKQLHIGVNHEANQLMKSHLWFPIEYFLRLGDITDQEIYFRRALITCVVLNKFFPIKIDM